MYSPQLTFPFMNLRDNQYVEMLFGNLSTQKYNYTYPELEVFSYSDDIIESIDILDPDINFFNGKNNSMYHYFTDEQFKSNVKCELWLLHYSCKL